MREGQEADSAGPHEDRVDDADDHDNPVSALRADRVAVTAPVASLFGPSASAPTASAPESARKHRAAGHQRHPN